MTEIWLNSEKGNDKLIAFADGTIYKANFKTDEEADEMARALRSGSFDSRKLWEIKAKHCKEIRLQDGKPYIELFFGKEGEEQLRITDEYKRHQVFDIIKANTPGNATTEKWNAFRAGRKPMIAFFVVLGLFLWTLYYAIQIENGTEYYFKGNGGFSLTGIIVTIASMGLVNTIIVFSILLGLAIFSFVRKAMNLPVMQRIFPSR
jgi:hypothetical protein